MKVLVDTSVWSLALRKKNLTETETKIIESFSELLRDVRVTMIGPIRQEILSGISILQKYEEVRTKLAIFVDVPLIIDDYETAAAFSNECRRNGIQGSHIDFLISAFSVRKNVPIFTLDNDFLLYQKIIPIVLIAHSC